MQAHASSHSTHPTHNNNDPPPEREKQQEAALKAFDLHRLDRVAPQVRPDLA